MIAPEFRDAMYWGKVLDWGMIGLSVLMFVVSVALWAVDGYKKARRGSSLSRPRGAGV